MTTLDAILNCYSPDDTVSDYQDKIRALFDSNEQTVPDAWKLLVAGLIRELGDTYTALAQPGPKPIVSIGQFRRLRMAKEMLRDAGMPIPSDMDGGGK